MVALRCFWATNSQPGRNAGREYPPATFSSNPAYAAGGFSKTSNPATSRAWRTSSASLASRSGSFSLYASCTISSQSRERGGFLSCGIMGNSLRKNQITLVLKQAAIKRQQAPELPQEYRFRPDLVR